MNRSSVRFRQAAPRGPDQRVPLVRASSSVSTIASVADERRQAGEEAARRHEEWLAANPEVRDELDGFDRLAESLDSGWSDLADAA
jgi:hypothetical protein